MCEINKKNLKSGGSFVANMVMNFNLEALAIVIRFCTMMWQINKINT
jgi:hypothetical protein